MPRHFTEDTLVIASHNPGKVKEIAELLKIFNINVKSASEFDELDEPEEDGVDFLENATIKSEYVSRITGLPALADDSGLCVDGLDGAPGIHSARWGGDNKDFHMAMERVGRELEEKFGDKQGDSAHFVCALSLTWPDGHTERFEGKVFGKLTFPQRGNHGFGYDAIFISDGYNETFAEMDPREKHRISHRADAFRQLVDGCFSSNE
jgi:XTP/dITP diphosphohydrolase